MSKTPSFVTFLLLMLFSQTHTVFALSGDSHCGAAGYCVTAFLSPGSQIVQYFLTIPTSPAAGHVGWWAIAQGRQMKGANMAICWIAPDGQTPVISHRSAGDDHQQPSTTLSKDANFAADLTKFPALDAFTTWSWNMTLPTSDPHNAVQHIFATSLTAPSSNDTNADIAKHILHEQGIVLDLTKSSVGIVMLAGVIAVVGPSAIVMPANRTSNDSRPLTPSKDGLLVASATSSTMLKYVPIALAMAIIVLA